MCQAGRTCALQCAWRPYLKPSSCMFSVCRAEHLRHTVGWALCCAARHPGLSGPLQPGSVPLRVLA